MNDELLKYAKEQLSKLSNVVNDNVSIVKEKLIDIKDSSTREYVNELKQLISHLETDNAQLRESNDLLLKSLGKLHETHELEIQQLKDAVLSEIINSIDKDYWQVTKIQRDLDPKIINAIDGSFQIHAQQYIFTYHVSKFDNALFAGVTTKGQSVAMLVDEQKYGFLYKEPVIMHDYFDESIDICDGRVHLFTSESAATQCAIYYNSTAETQEGKLELHRNTHE